MIMNGPFDSIKNKTKIKKCNNSIVGNISKEVLNGPMRGWICGHFYPRNSVFHRKDIEICLKKLPIGKTEKKHFHLCSFEFLIVLSGKVVYNIGGKRHVLTAGNYYILEPKETEHIVKVIEETTVLAVRLPSIPKNKISVKPKRKKN